MWYMQIHIERQGKKMYKCYLIHNDGTHASPLEVDTEPQAISFFDCYKGIAHQVVITDKDDSCVLHAIDGEIIFPLRKGRPNENNGKAG